MLNHGWLLITVHKPCYL